MPVASTSDKPALNETAPEAEYRRRRAARHKEVLRQERLDSRAGHLRLVLFVGILVVVYAAIRGYCSLAWVLPPIAAFAGAVAWHGRIRRKLARARCATDFYARALDRLDDRWAGTGPTGEHYLRPEHPYAGDLDLFGRGSLFQLLCAARTRMGQDTLAAWLLTPADPECIRARQAAVEELRGELDLREHVGLLDAADRADFDPRWLRTWAAGRPRLSGWTRPILAVVLAVAAAVSLAGWIFFGTGLWPFLAVAGLQAALLLRLRQPIRELTHDLDTAVQELRLLGEVLKVVEDRRFSSPRLSSLGARLQAGGPRPSQRIARLVRLLDYWDTVRRNQFVVPIAFVLMLVVHLAYAIERWRIANGRAVLDWLGAVGEFEALVSLATCAYEHPGHPFPEIVEPSPCLDAEGLGHPLISAKVRVVNDIALDAGRPLLLVSGSNMSGKSTLLRAIGVNVVLALAGAPVCAVRLRVSSLAIGSTMRRVDSLQEGVSAFYAEIRRLRLACDLTRGRLPVLFLFDEIFQGTNSHDRRIGAEAMIRSLLDRGAIGLITTHDLALTEVAERLAPRATNVHFEDQLADGRLHFDYRLRSGVVPRGNGLVLMRLLGLDVPDDE